MAELSAGQLSYNIHIADKVISLALGPNNGCITEPGLRPPNFRLILKSLKIQYGQHFCRYKKHPKNFSIESINWTKSARAFSRSTVLFWLYHSFLLKTLITNYGSIRAPGSSLRFVIVDTPLFLSSLLPVRRAVCPWASVCTSDQHLTSLLLTGCTHAKHEHRDPSPFGWRSFIRKENRQEREKVRDDRWRLCAPGC